MIINWNHGNWLSCQHWLWKYHNPVAETFPKYLIYKFWLLRCHVEYLKDGANDIRNFGSKIKQAKLTLLMEQSPSLPFQQIPSKIFSLITWALIFLSLCLQLPDLVPMQQPMIGIPHPFQIRKVGGWHHHLSLKNILYPIQHPTSNNTPREKHSCSTQPCA